MRTQTSKAIIVALVLACALYAQQGDWVRVAPPSAGFSILMPTRPTEGVETKEEYTLHSFGASAGTTIFVAVYVDYAPSTKLNEAAELAANRDNLLKGMNARLTSSKEIKLDGHAGLEFTGADDRRLYMSRVYISGNRVHQIGTAVLKEDQDSENVDRFFGSFVF